MGGYTYCPFAPVFNITLHSSHILNMQPAQTQRPLKVDMVIRLRFLEVSLEVELRSVKWRLDIKIGQRFSIMSILTS